MEHGTYRKIMLVVEGAESDRSAGAAAVELAVTCHATLILLNFVDLMVVNRMKRFVEQSAAELEIELEEKGWRSLYHVEELSKMKGVTTLILQRIGVPEREILQEAERMKVDLIVLSSPREAVCQARKLGPRHLEFLAEHAPCELLIVKH